MFKWTSRFISEGQPPIAVVLIYLSESGTQGSKFHNYLKSVATSNDMSHLIIVMYPV